MRHIDRLDPLVRFWVLCLAVFLVLETADRLAVLGISLAGGAAFRADMLLALPYGFLADVATGFVLGAPFLAGLFILAPLWRRRWARMGAHVLLLAMLGVLAFCEASGLFFWNEFDSRYNSIAVNYLIFPREVIGNIRESFNMAIVLPPVGLVALALYAVLYRPFSAALQAPVPRGTRLRRAGLALALGIVGLSGMYFWHPNMFGERQVNEAAKNGIHSLLRAALTNDEDFDGLYLTMPKPEADRLVRQMVAQDNATFLKPEGEDPLLRRVVNEPREKPLNVMFVLEESFGSIYVDDLDSPYKGEQISPNLSRLAKDGLFFTNVYATGNRTVRGLEAILTSFPPIPGISTTRRSGSEGMNSLPFLLKRFGYKTSFLYGGLAAFDNMGPYWSSIGFDPVWGQGDVADPGFSTIWGVADEYLFTEALRRMDQMTADGGAAYLHLLTVSNHRPYTYPVGRIDKDPARKRRENAATYADWAFGDFIERAKDKPWFKDTIFIFVGDHGPRVYGAAQVPVPSYRVPLLFYAPGHIAAERNQTLGSSMDVGPTLLGLLGLSYDSPFFGIDLRRVPEGKGRVAMEHNFSVALGDGKDVAMLLPGRDKRGWSMTIGPADLQPEAEPQADLLRQAIALFQTAHHLFYAGRYHDLSAPAPSASATP